MARLPKREHRLANLECANCGQQFKTSVPHLGHYVAESAQPVLWVVDRINVACPSCGSRRVGEQAT